MPHSGESIRVALVSSDVSPQSGAARCVLQLARGLQQRDDVEPILYLCSDGPLAEQTRGAGITVRITGAHRPSLRKGVLSLLRYVLAFSLDCARFAFWLRKDRIHLIHANEFIEFQAGVAGRLAGLPTIYHVRWPLDGAFVYRLMAKLTAQLASDLVAVSKATAEACFRACGRRPHVVYDPGPDTEEFRPSDSPGEVLEEFSLPPDAQLVILVSKLIPEKGHEAFLRAAAEAAPHCPSARFLIVGGGVPGAEEYARHVRRLSRQEPLSGRVIFAGPRDDVPRLLGASAVAVHLPSFPDPFPGVVLEAMSCGCSVVASAIGGVPEQVTDGVDGVLVPPGDMEAVAAAVDDLLGDAERRSRMGQKARSAVMTRFSIGRHTGELLSLYKAVARDRPRRNRPQNR